MNEEKLKRNGVPVLEYFFAAHSNMYFFFTKEYILLAHGIRRGTGMQYTYCIRRNLYTICRTSI